MVIESIQSGARDFLLQVGYAKRFDAEHGENLPCPRAFIACGFLIVNVAFGKGVYGFALQFQAARQCRLHHLSGKAHIVVGHPSPEVNLLGQQQGAAVDNFLHFLV